MTRQEHSLYQIERALREEPFCHACGSVTQPIAEGGLIWLRCGQDAEPKTGLARLTTLLPLGGHARREITADVVADAA